MRLAFAAVSLLTLTCVAGAAAADTFGALTEHMTVVRHGNVVVATRDPPETAGSHARRISAYDVEIRRRYFASLEDRPIRFIIGDDASELQALAAAPISGVNEASADAFGYYRSNDRIIVASTADGYGAVLRELMRALLEADNPDAPHWFETAMASLYESSRGQGAALAPALDERMARIAVDEDLDFDVFAGICDCYPLTPQQRALMRLLVVHLHERGELGSLIEAVERKGKYVTLLECLDAMNFDRQAWKTYAERSVRDFWKARDESS